MDFLNCFEYFDTLYKSYVQIVVLKVLQNVFFSFYCNDTNNTVCG